MTFGLSIKSAVLFGLCAKSPVLSDLSAENTTARGKKSCTFWPERASWAPLGRTVRDFWPEYKKCRTVRPVQSPVLSGLSAENTTAIGRKSCTFWHERASWAPLGRTARDFSSKVSKNAVKLDSFRFSVYSRLLSVNS